MHKIESNIPMPKPRGYWKEFVFKMQVGDSTVVTKAEASALIQAARVLNFKVSTKAEANGIRVWLVNK
jgi:hypothetical protein